MRKTVYNQIIKAVEHVTESELEEVSESTQLGDILCGSSPEELAEFLSDEHDYQLPSSALDTSTTVRELADVIEKNNFDD